MKINFIDDKKSRFKNLGFTFSFFLTVMSSVEPVETISILKSYPFRSKLKKIVLHPFGLTLNISTV